MPLKFKIYLCFFVPLAHLREFRNERSLTFGTLIYYVFNLVMPSMAKLWYDNHVRLQAVNKSVVLYHVRDLLTV